MCICVLVYSLSNLTEWPIYCLIWANVLFRNYSILAWFMLSFMSAMNEYIYIYFFFL